MLAATTLIAGVFIERRLDRNRPHRPGNGVGFEAPVAVAMTTDVGVVVTNPAVVSPVPDRFDDVTGPAVIAYDGRVWDNVTMRIRGGISRFYEKVSWKVEMPEGHLFTMPGIEWPLDEFNLQRDQRPFPDIGWDLIDVDWSGPGAIATEEEARTGGYFEKMEGDPDGFSDIQELTLALAEPAGPDQLAWIHDNFDVPALINYLAVLELLRHVDSQVQNYTITIGADPGEVVADLQATLADIRATIAEQTTLRVVPPSQVAEPDVHITEIHYRPEAGSDAEFVELHNPGATAVDISGWSLDDGVDRVFRAGTVIPPRRLRRCCRRGRVRSVLAVARRH